MPYKAFISSTFDDLEKHRAAVIAAMRKAGIHVDPMEDWAAASDEPSELSQERLSGCDLCVLLVAFRRGHVPGGEGSSITQLEYEAALDQGIKVLVFMLADDEPWPRKFDELDKDPLIGAWRTELRERHICSSFGLDPASIEIEPALVRWIAERQAGPSVRERCPPFMADPLPADFVERPEKFTEIKRKLLDAQGEPVAITAALRGAGGFGKTVLANALCHDPEIKDAFSGGILRVTLGERPENLVGRMADLVEILTGELPGVTHIEAAKTKLAEALDDRRCLLVIDDVWRHPDLAPFLHRGPKDRTTRLVTTRDDGVLPKEAVRVPVDAMTSDQALTMLIGGLGDDAWPPLRDRLAKISARLGEWPLLLSLANGVLRTRIARGASLRDALSYLEVSLTERRLGGTFARHDAAARRSTGWSTLEVSLDQLSEAERMRFAELAVFVEDAEISTSAALGLWRQTAGLSELDGGDLLERLTDLSLLIDLDLGRGLFRLHDVFRSLLREELIKVRLVELDGKLMSHFRSTCPGGDLACLTDRYGLRHAIAHLRGAGEGEAADRLLLDPAWMQTKLGALGVQPLLADYVGQPKQSVLLAIGAALALAVGVLAKRPRELPAQLLARLSPEKTPELAPFLERVRASFVPPGLVPLRPTFTPPGAELLRLEGHEHWVRSVTVLADGRRALSGSDDRTLRLWNLETSAELRRFEGHEGWVSGVAVLADGRRALSASFDRTLRLWDLESGAELRHFEGHDGIVTSVTVLADGRRALSGSYDKTLRLWDLDTGVELRRFEGHQDWVTSVTVLGDGRRALSGSTDNTLRLWDLETCAELRRFEGHGDWVTSVAVLSDGRRALSGSDDRTLRLWDLESGAELRRFEGHVERVTSVTASADGRRALSGSDDRTLRLWDLDTGVELRRFEGHEDVVSSVTMLADGRRALSGSFDRTLRLWDLESRAELRRFEGHEGVVTRVTVLTDGRRALSGSEDKALRLWDLESCDELRRFDGHEGVVTSVTALADGRRALSGSRDQTLRLWDLESGAELRRFEGHGERITSVTVLADGRRALSGSGDKTLRLWDLDSGTELCRFEGHEDRVTSVAVLGDERRALSGARDRTLRLWDLETGAELRRFEGHRDWVGRVAVLPDGWRALSGSDDKTLRLWNLESGAELRRFKGHERVVTSVTVLADGRRALSGSRDQTLRLWDLDSGAELRRFEGHGDWVTSVTVFADGWRALSGSWDKTLRLWDLETGAELACLTFDASPSALAWSERLAAAVVGDVRGLVHVIELLDRPPDAAPVPRDSGSLARR